MNAQVALGASANNHGGRHFDPLISPLEWLDKRKRERRGASTPLAATGHWFRGLRLNLGHPQDPGKEQHGNDHEEELQWANHGGVVRQRNHVRYANSIRKRSGPIVTSSLGESETASMR